MCVYAMPFWIAIVRVMSSDSQIARTVPWIAIGLRPAIDAAMSWARSRRSARGNDLGDESEPQRRLGSDALLGAHQRPPQDVAERNAAGQHADRLERRDDAAVGMRIEELRIVGADDDVGLVDEVLTAAGAHPVHGGDDRLPHPVMELRREQSHRGRSVFQTFDFTIQSHRR